MWREGWKQRRKEGVERGGVKIGREQREKMKDGREREREEEEGREGDEGGERESE